MWLRAAAATCGSPSTPWSCSARRRPPKDGTLLSLTDADAKALAQRSAMRYDRGGDAMYDAGLRPP